MPDRNNPSQGAEPAPDWRPHPLPRRVSPENSITLRHHRLARDASMKAGPEPSVKTSATHPKTSRRNSSGESHVTGNSDPNTWFDQSNENPSATFNGPLMDVDPPFFQKETDMSYDDAAKDPQLYRFDATTTQKTHLQPTVAQSSSADDYRSVIDDLTVEIQRLKEELKRYKRNDPDSLKKEKLFEIKVHGLPQRKKRELEATLRDFAASLDGTTSAGASSQRKKSARHPTQMYSTSGSNSKHSSSGSNSRPVDSAYASASTGRNSSGTSGRPSITSSRQRTADQKVESYLREIPEGLYPRHMVMTDKDRKKLVVRRLEHIFTGKLSKRSGRIPQTGGLLAPVTTDNSGASSAVHQPPSLEPAREARILPSDANKKGGRSRDNGSTSNSNGDQTESGGNGSGTANGVGIAAGTGPNTSPPTTSPPEQRPTRPRDLDPDRVQIPSENMEYIRHLGLVPPELLQNHTVQNVSPDADGWVYLNLLCNLAQLHMFNVTPDYIRAAVSEKSTKFQMSTDGRKIRWRGGQDGTKFSSDSSGDNSQKSPSTDDTDASKTEVQRRKHKIEHQLDDGPSAGLSSSKITSKLGRHLAGSSESFHYQPLFAKRTVSQDSSRDDTESSVEVGEGSNGVGSRWGFSGSGSSQRKKRRFNGGITYYNGAPFCTDLSGDTGDVSPTTYMVSSREHQQQSASTGLLSTQMSVGADTDSSLRPQPSRTTSGSWLKIRPLSDENFTVGEEMDIDEEAPSTHEGLLMDDSDLDCDMSWSDSRQTLKTHELEASGLGGIMPEDHFVVMVATRRPKRDEPAAKMVQASRTRFDVTADAIIRRLASMSTSSPRSPQQYQSSSLQSERSSRSTSPSAVAIEYVQGRIKRLSPTPLPPPATFFKENSESSDEEADELEGFSSEQEADALLSSEGFMSRRANPHLSDNPYPEDEEITSADEVGEEPEEDDHALKQRDAEMPDLQGTEEGESEASDVEGKLGRRRPAGGSVAALTGSIRSKSIRSKSIRSKSADVGEPVASSLATAGGAESGYSSGEESEK